VVLSPPRPYSLKAPGKIVFSSSAYLTSNTEQERKVLPTVTVSLAYRASGKSEPLSPQPSEVFAY
jgi:hypothetical protein